MIVNESSQEVLLDENVLTDYGIFVIWWGPEGFAPDPDDAFRKQSNGIVGTGIADCIYFFLGVSFGLAHVRILALPGEPPTPVGSHWRDVVEVSVRIPKSEQYRWSTTEELDGGDLPSLTPGNYRVRMSELDQDAAAQGLAPQNEAQTQVLIELWPSPPLPDLVIRALSASGQSMHLAASARASAAEASNSDD